MAHSGREMKKNNTKTKQIKNKRKILQKNESRSVVSLLFATPWTIESVEFPRPEYWSGQPFPSPGDLPNPRVEPRSPTLQTDSLPAEPQLNYQGSPSTKMKDCT